MRSEVGFRAGMVAALMFLGACAKEQKPAPDAADLVIKNARIHTVDAAFPWATSLAIDGGKSADFIVLDRDLFNIFVTEIGRTKVLTTVIAGEAVYGTL